LGRHRLVDRDLQDEQARSASYLRDVLTKIVARHQMSRIDELLPFAYLPPQAEKTAA
jgi:hypothetical protein